jgi:dTDP-4-dehydrorhamnose 3,5-epimerase
MKIQPTGLDGFLIVEPRVFRDERGFFLEVYQIKRYREAGIADVFIQENHSHSMKRGILRGLHYQIKRPQAQIITVFRGRILDVVVDIRPGSRTFGEWRSVELSDEGPRQVYMAPGFAHGFLVLSDVADVHYNVSRNYDHTDEGGLVWNDPDIGIEWPIETPHVLLRDAAFPRLKDLGPDRLPYDPPTEIE